MCLLAGRTLVPGPGSPNTFPSPGKQELPWCLPSVLPHMPLLAPSQMPCHLVGRGGCSRGISLAVVECSWFLGVGAQQTGHCCEAEGSRQECHSPFLTRDPGPGPLVSSEKLNGHPSLRTVCSPGLSQYSQLKAERTSCERTAFLLLP